MLDIEGGKMHLELELIPLPLPHAAPTPHGVLAVRVVPEQLIIVVIHINGWAWDEHAQLPKRAIDLRPLLLSPRVILLQAQPTRAGCRAGAQRQMLPGTRTSSGWRWRRVVCEIIACVTVVCVVVVPPTCPHPHGRAAGQT